MVTCQASACSRAKCWNRGSAASWTLPTTDDRQFYSVPRIGVHHLDAGFRAQLTELFRQRIPEGAVVLDLCSSWVSHLPADKKYGRVVCHGLSAPELAANRQASDFFVRNLNTDPTGWALADGSVDAVVCTASVQYLQQPEAVFGEIARVLRPGGVCVFSFSNRLFYNKAIAAWRDNSDWGRCQLVKSYFAAATGAFGEPEVVKGVEVPAGGAVQRLQAWAGGLLGGGGVGDPFFAVVAYRQ
ncbi:S-adenosyl-L-methionine-dependent [Micractinium conductrix]|uniref:S-adenosyl-L-methionine-dependent n=1 Tax=Micractinium conductrix TaxID=554055 RepID=A0A2P6V6A0_9CHLO|nr:S-adenosyl-L-methionine-dependent [Micractinium conductrix]|eukprot:PSC69600.1 S-adenosyl-L-methionine-dependent [Micractinium conductrix]